MAEVDRMLAANARWAQQAPGGQPARPARAVAVVACMDARMDVYRILGLEPGDAHVIRNAGGVVTTDTLRSLAISQHVLGTREVVLVHHTRCGMEGADEDVRESMRLLHESPYLLSREVRGTVYDVTTGKLHEVS